MGSRPAVTQPVLCVLGPMLAGAAGSEAPLQALRQRRILTLLAVGAALGRAIPAQDLVTGAYGEADGPKVRRSLSTELWRCRQLLGSDSIASGPDGYRLAVDKVRVDVLEFVNGVRDGRRALEDGDYEAAEDGLGTALGLWRGTALPDSRDHPEVLALVARLDELRVGAAEDHAEALARVGRHREAIEELEAITGEHPHREHACALLISSYLAVGDHRRAGTTLDTARRALAEYGVDLGSELMAARDALGQPTSTHPLPAPGAELIGRDADVATIVAIGAAALYDYATTAVLVTGEAGIGKSALVKSAAAELATAGGARNTVERVVCDKRLSLPYAAITPVLERLRAHTAQPPAQTQAMTPFRTTESLVSDAAELIENAADSLGGLALVVEDVQWASAEVLELLLVLLARQTPVPLFILATLRDPVTTADYVAPAISELRRRCGAVVHLAGLTVEHVARLLGPEVDQERVRAAHRLTGGNPLYLRSLGERGLGQAASLREALDEHIDSLPPDAVRLLGVAAVIGVEFDVRVLIGAVAHAPLGVDPSDVSDALRIAADAGVVEVAEDAPRLRFVHGLLRDRLLTRTPASDRVTAHALVARALERLAPLAGPDAVSADVLAHHSVEGWPACPTADVVTRLKAAGLEATRQVAYEAAHTYFARALDLVAMDPGYSDEDEVGSLLLFRGQAATASGDATAARMAYGALRAYGAQISRPEFQLRGSLGTLQTYSAERVSDQALDELEAAVRVTEQDASGDLPADILPEAIAALHVYRADRARCLADAAIARDPRVEQRVLARIWDQEVPLTQLRIAERLADFPESDRLTVRVRQHAAGVAAGEQALTDLHVGWSADEGPDWARWEALLWQITTAIAVGRFARADRLIAVATEQIPLVDTSLGVVNRRSNVNSLRAWLAILRLDAEAVAETFANVRATWNIQRPITRVLSAYALTMAGSREQMLARCDELVDEFIDGAAPGRHQLGPIVALASGSINAGHERGIALTNELLQPHRGMHVVHYVTQYFGAVEYHLARLAAARGDLDTAIEECEAALAAHRRSGTRVFEALSLRAAAAVRYHRDRGTDRADAVTLDQQAAALGAEIGLPQLTRGAWPPAGPLDLGGPYGPPAGR